MKCGNCKLLFQQELEAPYNTHFNGYGLGGFKRCKGYKQVTHTGGLENRDQTTYIPELQLELLYLQINNQLHLMLLQSRTVTWESLQRIMLVFIVIAKSK
jgi:hypothetical protein